jgi:hypothetical protein
MQINLKQDEIAKAVKLFLKDQGIKTQGKYISIQFSMGKGLNGLKAEVNVEESDVPGFGQQDPENPDTPMEVLATVTEPEQPAPTPLKVTVGKLVRHHVEEVAQKIEAPAEFVISPEAQAVIDEEIRDHEAANAAATEATNSELEVLGAEAEATGAPWNDEAVAVTAEPDLSAAGDDVGLEINKEDGNSFQVVLEEPAIVTAAEPVVEAAPVEEAKPVVAARRTIFGAKKAEAASAVVAEVEDSGSLIPSDEVKQELATPAVSAPMTVGAVRRGTSSLFKKPSA